MFKAPFPSYWLLVSLALSITGCGYQVHRDDNPASAVPASTTLSKPFPADALYSLLVAETATQRGQMDIALANYYQQAYKTRDPSVVRRAALLAEYLNASQATLDLAQLWSDIEPDNPEPVYLAGRCLVEFQRLDQAVATSQRLLELNAQSLFVSIALSPAAASAQTQTTLLTQYATLLDKYPDNIDLLLGNAALLSQQGNYDAGLSSVDQALSVNNQDLQTRLFEVDILYKSGRPDKALKKMASIVEDDPDNTRLRMQYAQMLTDQDLEKAREQFEYLAVRNSLEPDLLLSRALVNFRLKDYVQAKDLFEQLLFLKRHIDIAQYYLGEIAIANQKPGRAIEHFRRVASGEQYISAVTQAFDLMIQQNRRLEGQQWLADQRKLHPELSLKLYMVEANVLLKNGDNARCLASLDEAIKSFPTQPELHYARSLLFEREGNIPAAETELRLVLKQQPDNVNALNALGYLLANNNQKLPESYALLNRALALSPDNPAILDSMGWLLFRMHKNDEALLRLKKSFALDPNDEVAAHLGEVLWSVGKQEEAVHIWLQGLQITPNSVSIKATRARVQPANIFR